MRITLVLLSLSLLLTACAGPQVSSAAATTTPLPAPAPPPTPASLFASNGGGEPRTASYWLRWNTCAPGNQAITAQANGGRAAGWILMDDLLVDPGILVGSAPIVRCTQGVNLLEGRDLAGVAHTGDAAYALATQLLVAQLNLVSGSEDCPAADQAVQAAQLLLAGLDFDGTKSYLGPPVATRNVETAEMLIDQLATYNTGALCVP